jgi:O-antigen/teichoic acid export membrane protein
MPPMNSLRKNVAANIAGNVWNSLMGLAFIPIYIKFMGIESFGLLGVFATLQGVLGLLDVGLGGTLTREMARLSVVPRKEHEMRNLVRTLETLYWGIAVSAGTIVASLTPVLAHRWINTGQLTEGTIEQSLLIMGLVLVFQMPIGFYSGGLQGLQRQVLLNAINVLMSTFRGLGAIGILWLVSPTIQAFLVWQVVVSLVNAVALAWSLWRNLPHSEERPLFQKQLLRGIWRFSAGMSGISVLAVILTQADKIVLSKILSLPLFGYYMLASAVGLSLSRVTMPVFVSIYPRFTQLVSLNDEAGLKRQYHQACQFLSVLILPIAVFVALFSSEVLLLWTRNPTTVQQTHGLVSILICGTALNGLMHAPYALQLAFGWTRLSIYKNVLAVILVVPMMLYMAGRYGATGAAIVWLLLNVGDVIFEVPIMHRRILRREEAKWFWADFLLPLAAASSVGCIGRLLLSEPTSQLSIVLWLVAILVATIGVTAVATKETRMWLLVNLPRATW